VGVGGQHVHLCSVPGVNTRSPITSVALPCTPSPHSSCHTDPHLSLTLPHTPTRAPQVKNIDQIELGRHVMDTWYFSPFPPEFKDCKVWPYV
jgi:hypothetical protein